MNPMRVILWIVIAISIFAVSLIIHKEFMKRSIFQEIYGKYKGNLEKKIKERANGYYYTEDNNKTSGT